MTDKNPSIAIAIISYNRFDYLSEAIDSALKQTCAPKEIFIIDNASPADVIQKIESKISGTTVGLHTLKSGVRPVFNFERAIKHCTSDYLLMMHDDDRLMSNYIEEQLKSIKNHPQISAIACDAILIDHNGNTTGQIIRSSRYPNPFFLNSFEESSLYYLRHFIPFPTILYRRNAMPESFAPFASVGKVWDGLLVAAMAKNGSIAWNPNALYEYRVHPGQDSVSLPESELKLLHQQILKDLFRERKIYWLFGWLIYLQRTAKYSIKKLIKK